MPVRYRNTTDTRLLIRDLLVWDPQRGIYFPIEFAPHETKDFAIWSMSHFQLNMSSGFVYFKSLGFIERLPNQFT